MSINKLVRIRGEEHNVSVYDAVAYVAHAGSAYGEYDDVYDDVC
jgi:hypothetical protein